MSKRAFGVIPLGFAAIVLFWPVKVCRPNPVSTLPGAPEEICSPTITNLQAIQLGWPQSTLAMVAVVALSGLGAFLLLRSEGPTD